MVLVVLAVIVVLYLVLAVVGHALWFIVSSLVAGLVIGALARAVLPGRQQISIPMTIGIGIVGSVLGGLIARGTHHGHLLALVLEVAIAAGGIALLEGGASHPPPAHPVRLAVCSSKGGVGKTATAANLAAVLARSSRVLAVDADPQDSLGRSYGVVAKSREDSLAGLLEQPELDPRSVVRRGVAPGLDLLPAHASLEAVGTALASQGGIVTGLRRVLRPLLADYDHVVIDTHGDLGNLTLSAVCAADAVLTVFTSDPGSAHGVARVAAFVAQHQQFENTSAQLIGVACSLWDAQGRAAREVLEALAQTGLPLLPTKVPLSRRVPSATLDKRPVVLSSPSSSVAVAYTGLAEDVLDAYGRAVA